MGRRQGLLPRRGNREDGTSLAEMMIGMFLAALLGLIVMQAFIASSKGARHVSDDATVQQQQQTVVERMTRDLRVARGLDSTSTASKVVVWDDLNSDYARQTGETVTWMLQTVGSQCQIVRSTDAGTSKIMATTLTNTGCGSAYLYYDGTGATATSVNATRVDVSLSFRASSSSGAGTRQSQFSVRMRNVA